MSKLLIPRTDKIIKTLCAQMQSFLKLEQMVHTVTAVLSRFLEAYSYHVYL
jgi:hypothetical protein